MKKLGKIMFLLSCFLFGMIIAVVAIEPKLLGFMLIFILGFNIFETYKSVVKND